MKWEARTSGKVHQRTSAVKIEDKAWPWWSVAHDTVQVWYTRKNRPYKKRRVRTRYFDGPDAFTAAAAFITRHLQHVVSVTCNVLTPEPTLMAGDAWANVLVSGPNGPQWNTPNIMRSPTKSSSLTVIPPIDYTITDDLYAVSDVVNTYNSGTP